MRIRCRESLVSFLVFILCACSGGAGTSSGDAVCGDGVRTGDEVCDGTDLGSQSCEGQGLGVGTLQCSATCDAFVTEECCIPDCTGRECGLDPVCSQPCGSCDQGSCNVRGQCQADTGDCDDDCTNLRYSACSCAASDPCGWQDDGYCDGDCATAFPSNHFDDAADCTCVPTSCAAESAECGTINDGCGGTLSCGGCSGSASCGGGGTPNVCGQGQCIPTTCIAEGLDCGIISDGCDGTLNCGSCSGSETCGGGGTANICGSTGSTAQWSKISTGAFHSCAIKNDGTLWCWGRNNSGQLGDGTMGGGTNTPTRIGVSFGWTDIAAGGFHTCGINYDHLYCWGNNDVGQIGDGTTTARATPTLIDGLTTYSNVVAGFNTSCAVSSDFYCWGSNMYGQIDSNTLGDFTTPQYHGGPIEIGLGGGHMCKRYWQGGVLCAGLNSSGQLGINSAATTAPPTLVFISNQNWSRLYAGGSHTCALYGAGLLYCWGDNSYGQLGNSIAANAQPSMVDGLSDWETMGLGDAHTCGVKENTNLYCWGANNAGQIGDGSLFDREEPVLIGSGFASVSGGFSHTCSIDSSNRLWCWGDNTYGQLGTGNNTDAQVPTLLQ